MGLWTVGRGIHVGRTEWSAAFKQAPLQDCDSRVSFLPAVPKGSSH